MRGGVTVEIGSRTLLVAIQAVAQRTRAMRAALEASDGAEGEDWDLLERWEAAAEDLEDAYNALTRKTGSVPPYEQLTGEERGG